MCSKTLVEAVILRNGQIEEHDTYMKMIKVLLSKIGKVASFLPVKFGIQVSEVWKILL